MQIKYIVPLILIFLLGCIIEKEDNGKIDEVPGGVIVVNQCETLTDSIISLFPDGQNSYVHHPEYYSDTVMKKIILTKESEVYVTFIDESAGYQNSLCWYSYNKNMPPDKVSDLNLHILFPNISKKGEGGELEKGYTLQLGDKKFPAGTVIGFALVVKGWKNGTIDYSGDIHFFDYDFNYGHFQQHVLYKESKCGAIVVGFEDLSIDKIECDKDFNDILFTVTDNTKGIESNSFDLNKMIVE